MNADSQDAVFAVLSTISPDRVGVVAAVTRFLAEHNANVEASHATRLAGFYGAQFLVSAAPVDMDRIERNYRDGLKEFSPALCPVAAAPAEPREGGETAAVPYTLTVLAYDRKGIIAETSGVLASLGISIVTLAADKYRAAESGAPLFRAEMQVRVPTPRDLDALSAALAGLETRHGWQMDLAPQVTPSPSGNPPQRPAPR
jgi:glycine cleavage system regulatory protein